MQACASHLRSLTRLEARYISTSFGKLSPGDLFAGLPALQHLRLDFSTADAEFKSYNWGDEADRHKSHRSMQPNKLWFSLLR